MRQRGLFVDATAYFPGERLFATISILFEIGATDVLVTPYMRYSIYSCYWYKSTNTDETGATDALVTPHVRYSIFSLSGYNSTNTDAEGGAGSIRVSNLRSDLGAWIFLDYCVFGFVGL
jgi:hypothetical protein